MVRSEVLRVGGQDFAPGENGVARVSAGRLPSGELIRVNMQVYRSAVSGPVVFLLAGMHGDEVCGVEILRRMVVEGTFERLVRGTLIVMPLINVYGFMNFERDLPDGKDINRSFPGSMSGSLASRIARIISKHILPVSDMGVDFHTGGASRYNYPQIRVSRTSREAHAMAEMFAPPYVITKPAIGKSLRKAAQGMGKPVIVYEGGEAGRIDGMAIREGMAGSRRLLRGLGMLEEAPEAGRATVFFSKASWVRAEVSGIFVWSRSSGDRVLRGEELGVIYDPYGSKGTPVLSKVAGSIIGHNNAPVVVQGDALFHIGHESGF